MPPAEIPLSKYGKASSKPSPVNRMMSAFAADFRDGVDINLGVGYVDEAAIPSRRLSEAFAGVLNDPVKHRTPFNYGGPPGSPNLIESLRKHLPLRRHGAVPAEVLEKKRIIVGPSGITSLLEAVGRVVEPGIVVTADPLYYIYSDYLTRMDFEVVAVPEDAEGLDMAFLERKLASLGKRLSKLRFFYFVTVNNPTCTILSNARRLELVRLASALTKKLRRKIPVLFDKAYEDLVHDPTLQPLRSMLPHDPDGLVHEMGTLSKILAPALRIGYLAGPDSPFLDALVQKTSDTGFSAPLLNQEMASYLLDRHIEEQESLANASYRRKALKVRKWIEEELGAFLQDVRGGQAGFYYYLTFKTVDTREGSLFHRILGNATGDPSLDGTPKDPRPKVVYLPGAYCVHSKGPLAFDAVRQLRLSYAYESEDRIHQGLERIGLACAHVIHRT